MRYFSGTIAHCVQTVRGQQTYAARRCCFVRHRVCVPASHTYIECIRCFAHGCHRTPTHKPPPPVAHRYGRCETDTFTYTLHIYIIHICVLMPFRWHTNTSRHTHMPRATRRQTHTHKRSPTVGSSIFCDRGIPCKKIKRHAKLHRRVRVACVCATAFLLRALCAHALHLVGFPWVLFNLPLIINKSTHIR